jgi:hypothetical protein
LQPIHLELGDASWVATNIQAFSWNAFAIDQQLIPKSSLRVYNGGLAVRIPAGKHELTSEFVPDRIWRILRAISQLAMLLWCIQMFVVATLSVRRTRAWGWMQALLQRRGSSASQVFFRADRGHSPANRTLIRWFYDVATDNVPCKDSAIAQQQTTASVIMQLERARLLMSCVLLSCDSTLKAIPVGLDQCAHLLESYVQSKALPAMPDQCADVVASLATSHPSSNERLDSAQSVRYREGLECLIVWLRDQVELSGLIESRSTNRIQKILIISCMLGLIVWGTVWISTPKNQALYRPVTMSSQFPGTPSPEGATDGKISLAYQAHTAIDGDPWIMVDLGVSGTISKVVVHNRSDGLFGDTLPLTLELSDDGKNFRTVDRRTTAFTSAEPWIYVGHHTGARYVRVHGRPDGYVVVNEIEVYR